MTMALTLPNVSNAKLPAGYEAAKTALSQCSRIDECAEWANKAEALASYAKQADDDTLRKTADRIQARAIRRCGELLNEIKAGKAGRPNKSGPVAAPISRSKVAEEAGLSPRQQKTAQRVARVPQQDFERAVESDDPPTVTKLAEAGTQRQPKPLIDLLGRDPKEFAACTAAMGRIRDLEDLSKSTSTAAVIRGASERERQRMAKQLPAVIQWLTELLSAAKDSQ